MIVVKQSVWYYGGSEGAGVQTRTGMDRSSYARAFAKMRKARHSSNGASFIKSEGDTSGVPVLGLLTVTKNGKLLREQHN